MRGLLVAGTVLGCCLINGLICQAEDPNLRNMAEKAKELEAAKYLPDPTGNTDPAAILKDYPKDTEGTPTPALEALKKAVLPSGFEMTVFAAEPQVMQPIAINVDDRGRLWVAECFSYPQWAKTGRDRLTILEDTDGDGRMDKRKVFWDRGNYLTGFIQGHGGVWVCCAPDLLFIPDKDGDDVPDGPPVVVLTGWSTQGKHNVVNSLQWGPDGWLYGCNGITSPSKVGPPDMPEAERTRMECGVWRYHPTRKTFEVVMHGGTNPFGIDWNAEGEAFVTNCVIGHLFHVIPGAHYQRMFGQDLNPYAYELMPPSSDHFHWAGGDWQKARGGADNDALGGGHAHSGALFLLGEQWPKEMQGDLITCNIHGNRINRDHPAKTSTGYTGQHRPDLIKFNDEWFRGVAFAAAPDGSVYVADWCDVGECHDYKEVHRNSGRIYKFWNGKLKKWKPENLEAAKKSPWKVDAENDPWTARRIIRQITERTSEERKKTFEEIKEEMYGFKPKDSNLPYNMLLNQHIQLANWAPEMSLPVINPDSDKPIPDFIRKSFLLNFHDDIVPAREPTQLHVQYKIDEETSGPMLMTFLRILQEDCAVKDRAFAKLWKNPIWKKPVPTKEENYAEWGAHRNLQVMTWLAMESVVAADPKWAAAQLLACPDPWLHKLILRRLTDEKDNAKLTANLTTLFDNRDVWNNKDRSYDLLGALQAGLAGRKGLALPKPWTALAETLQSHPDGRVRMQTLELSYQFGDPAITPLLLKNVGDAKKSRGERERALQLLARDKNPKLAEQLPTLLDDKELRSATIRALGMYDLANTPELLLGKFKDLSNDQQLSAVETLSGRKAWAKALLTALADKKLVRADVPVFLARQIEQFKDKDLSKQLHDTWGLVRQSSDTAQKRKAELQKFLTEATLKESNHAAGSLLFKENCAKCHKLLGSGAAVGPDLTGAQRGNLDYLLDNILDPSASVARDYRLSVVTLNDGRVLSGVVLEQNAATVKLRTTDGDQTISKSDIDELVTTNQSAMPEGLLERFDEKQIRDLIGYLQGAK
jgi:putative membrane-bound dehydrogenase-like protein